MYIRVNFDDFIEYQEKYGTKYLDKKHKYYIDYPSKEIILNDFKQVNEMFDGIKTSYDLTNNNNNYLIRFKTKSNNEYRFDLLKEPNTDIYHLAFSLMYNEEYHELSNLNESSEVFGKLSYILQELDESLNVLEYCIGATGDLKKDKIYQYMMKYVSSWDKRETTQYPLGWALYFKI